MAYKEVQEKVFSGKKAVREKWGIGKYIRSAVESDEEFINYPHKGLIVVECDRADCDCKICIFHASNEDMVANDWIIL